MFPNEGEYAPILAFPPPARQAAVEDALPDVLHLGVWCVVSAVQSCTTNVMSMYRSLVEPMHSMHTERAIRDAAPPASG
jgi:hypothetical protein